MCSCYVASRNSDSKEEEKSNKTKRGNNHPPDNRKQSINEDGGLFIMDSESRIMSKVKRNSSIASNGEPSCGAPLKSNLKRSASMVEEMNPKLNLGMRKVSWSDAHGKDIAHVQEFEPSEETEIGGVRNHCRCTIQ